MFSIIKTYTAEDEAFLEKMADRLNTPAQSYTDLSRSFLDARVKKKGREWFLYFRPALPRLYLYLWGVALLMRVLFSAPWWSVLIPVLMGFFLYLFWTPVPYLFLLYFAYWLEHKRVADFIFISKRDYAMNAAGWK